MIAAAVVAGGAATASAATISVTSAPDPVESLATQIGVSGTADATGQLAELTVKPAGGPGCGANKDADAGQEAIHARPAIGPYAETTNWTFDQAGADLLCAWIVDDTRLNDPVLAAASLTIAVRQPHLSLSIAAPTTILRGRTFQVAATEQTEAQRDVRVTLLPDTGRGCPANWDAAYGASGSDELVSTSVIGGPQTQTENVRLMQAGHYLVCGYVDYGEQVAPEATASAAIDVVPPCVVPHLRTGTSLRTAKARIVAAHCTVGKVVHVRSSRRRGTVVSLSPRPGTGHATHAPAQIAVSSGPPPRRRHHR